MAIRRCRCGYTTEDVFADGCPLCLRPLALVNDAGPPIEVPRRPYRRAVPFLAGGVILAMLVGVLGLSGQFRQPAGRNHFVPAPSEQKIDSTGRIRVGMHIGRAAKELEPVVVRNEPAGTKLSDALPRESTESGILCCQKGRRQLFVFFREGYVTGLQELPGPPGQEEWAEIWLNDGQPPKVAAKQD